MNDNRIAIISLTTNNKEVTSLLQKLKETNFHCIIICYGNQEKDRAFLETLAQYAKIYISNEGKGIVLKNALKHIKEKYRSNTLIVTLDGDGNNTCEDAIRICNEVMVERSALIIGKKGSNKNLSDKIINSVTKAMYKVTSGESITDAQSTLRAFSYNLIDFLLTVKGDKNEYEANVIFSCASHKIKIKEIDLDSEEAEIQKKNQLENIQESNKESTEKLKGMGINIEHFIIDYVLFAFLALFAGDHIIIANVFARCISVILKFNKERILKLELKEAFKEEVKKSCILLIIDTLFLLLINKIIHVPIFIAKIFTEILYALLSYGNTEFFLKNK